MSLFGESNDHEITQLEQLNINVLESSNEEINGQGTLNNETQGNTPRTENENGIERTPENPSSQVVHSSMRKKPATFGYSSVSHHRTYEQTSCRFPRFSNKKPPKGPFFISFKEKPVLIKTSNYDKRNRLSFFDQTFSSSQCIGRGSFGEVFKALCKDDKLWYAVKITMHPFQSPADRVNKLREVQKHELLPKHPNLISYIRAWEEYGFLYIQTELCQCSLMDYKMKVGIIPESDLWFFFGDIALAIRYLHSHDLLHVDIKPQNIMVSFDGICKLGDFSLIIDAKTSTKELMEGDGKYLAPEVLESGAHKSSDIFSFGMTMIDICTDLALPSSGDLWQGFRHKRIHHEFVKDVPPALLDVILLLLETDPNKRPTAEEICRIPKIAKCIHERQYRYLELNMWWILLTVGYLCLFASSWIVQPMRSAIMHAATYLKKIRSSRPRCTASHHVFTATSDESPMFRRGIIPQAIDFSRLLLKFEEGDEDYKYDDCETDSSDKMLVSQNDDVLSNVLETSASDEIHHDGIEEISGINVENLLPNSLGNIPELEQSGLSDTTSDLTNLYSHKTTFCQRAAGDVFVRNDCNTLLAGAISAKKTSSKENNLMPENFELELNFFACDTLGCEDREFPSTSGSIPDRPKSPEPPQSNEVSPLHDIYVTPPSNTTPSPFVCKTPARGRFDSAEERLHRYYWWRESFRSPTREIHQHAVEAAASNGTLAEALEENELSRIEMQWTPSFGDAIRRRSYFHMHEPSPVAKRAQIDNEDIAGDDGGQVDDPKFKKSSTDAK